jgi:hypothetical protein
VNRPVLDHPRIRALLAARAGTTAAADPAADLEG